MVDVITALFKIYNLPLLFPDHLRDNPRPIYALPAFGLLNTQVQIQVSQPEFLLQLHFVSPRNFFSTEHDGLLGRNSYSK